MPDDYDFPDEPAKSAAHAEYDFPDKAPAPRKAEAPPGVRVVQVPGGPPSYVDAAGKFIEEPRAPGKWQRLSEQFDPFQQVPEIIPEISKAAQSSAELAKSGMSDVHQNMLASGIGKVGLGALGVAASPITGAVNALIGQPAARIGGQEFSERANLVAGLLPGGPTAAKVAHEALPSTRGINKLVEMIGPENVPAVIDRLRANERLAPMDVHPTVQQLTQGLAVQPGPAQNVVAEAVKARAAGARGAVGEAYSELGPPPKALEVLDRIKDRAKDVGQREIQPVLEKAGPVDVSSVIKAIDEEISPGMQEFAKSGLQLSTRQAELARLKQKLVSENGEMLFDAKRLHEIQSETGTAAYQFSKSPDAAQKQAGAGLRSVNEKLVDAIDKVSGEIPLKEGNVRIFVDKEGGVFTDAARAKSEAGSRYLDLPANKINSLKIMGDPERALELSRPMSGAYRAGRANFADAKDVHGAFDRGLMLQRNRQGEAGITEDSPEAWARWAKSAKPDEVDAARLGALSAIHMKIGSMRNASRAGMDIPEVEFTKDKLGLLFGNDKADSMLRQLRDERDIAATNSKHFQNSQTAARLKGEEALKVRDVGGGNPLSYVAPVAAELLGQSAGFPLVGLLGSAAAKGVHLGFQKAGQVSDLARNAAFARAAVASGPERERVINALAAHPKVVRQLEKSRNALAPANIP